MFSYIVSRVRAWRERERAFEELMALDDRSLSDIGIRRADIPAVLSGDRVRDHDVFMNPTLGTPANVNAAARRAVA